MQARGSAKPGKSTKMGPRGESGDQSKTGPYDSEGRASRLKPKGENSGAANDRVRQQLATEKNRQQKRGELEHEGKAFEKWGR